MGAIQNSLNQLFMTSLGASYVLTQTPMAKDIKELQQLKRQEKSQAAVTRTAQELDTGGIPSSEAKQLSAEQRIPVAEEELKSIQAAQAVTQQRQKMGLRRTGAAKTPAQLYALGQQEAQQQELINRLKQSIEEKRGAQQSVGQREDMLTQLRNMGITVDNLSIHINEPLPPSDGTRRKED